MTKFKHQSIEVPFLDQTHKNFDQWAKWVEEKRAEIDLIQKLIEEARAKIVDTIGDSDGDDGA